MRIKKTSETRPLTGSIVNEHSTSDKNTYSCDYLNGCNTYSTTEVNTGKKWVNGKPIYKKTYTGTIPTLSGGWDTLFSVSSLSIDDLIDIEGMCGTGKLPRYSSSAYYIDIQKGGNYMQVMGASYSNQSYKVTLYYTKTTD